MAICPNSVLNGPAFCSWGLGAIFCIFSGKISLFFAKSAGQLTLSLLVEKIFTIGSTKFRGIRLCEPCEYMSGILHSDVLKKMVHRAGLRAQILEGSIIKVFEDVSG